MKFLFDFFPILLFFGVFKLAESNEALAFTLVSTYMGAFISGGVITPDQAPIMLATALAIAASVLQILYLKVRRRKVDGMLWVSFLIIVVFGGLTIYFHNKIFILWKPTIIYWFFAIAIAFSQFSLKKNLIRQSMQEHITMPDAVWARLSFAWIVFFAILGALNLLVAFVIFKDNTSAWVSFKVFGITGLLFAFFIGQTFYLSKYMEEEKA
jgi:intracellular septation protein